MSPERPYSHLRASDADRERVANFLREQHAVGRLDHDELEERLGRAYRAVTMGDLDRLIGDLPQPHRPAPRHAPAHRRRPPSRMALLPLGFAALLAFATPTLALVMFAVMAAVGLAVIVSVFAIGMALGPFIVVALLVMLALRRRRPPRHMHWRYY